MAFDQNNYVAAWGSGWVVLVNGVWYRPGCLAASSAYPPPTSAVWSDLTAAQTCYNQKHGGDETTPSKPPSTFGAWLQQNILGLSITVLAIVTVPAAIQALRGKK